MWYHLIGISGVSMRSIAQILTSQGHKVTGSDLKISGHSANNIVNGIDYVVYTSAVTPGSAGWVEIEEAKKRKIKLIKRGEMLAKLVSGHRVIAVSGTHGKTTTTAMLGLTLLRAGLDPLIIVGEEVTDLGGTVKIGKGEWAVIEACEYDKNFLFLEPEISIVTNIEEEHLDHYPGGLHEIKDTFNKFLLQTKKNGAIVACGDDKNTMDVIESINDKSLKIIRYGLNDENDFSDLAFSLSIPGDHNRRNALAVVAVASILKIDLEIVKKSITNFRGANRRFQIKGEKNGVTVIDDYGHHPTEIAALLSGVKEKYAGKKIMAIFWPHQYKRTKDLLNKFPGAFKDADRVIIKEIFFVPGRDTLTDVSGKDIVDLINCEKKDKARFIDDDEEIVQKITNELNSDWILITVGIPPIFKIAEKFLKK